MGRAVRDQLSRPWSASAGHPRGPAALPHCQVNSEEAKADGIRGSLSHQTSRDLALAPRWVRPLKCRSDQRDRYLALSPRCSAVRAGYGRTLGVPRGATIPQITSTITAPTVAPIEPAPSPGQYQPSACPAKVATNAPTIPRIVVRMNPDGSFGPGCKNFAMMPATKPIIIVQIMPIAVSVCMI